MNCSICLQIIAEFEKVILHENHTFHQQCISEWLKQNNSCPLCRKKVPQNTLEKSFDITIYETYLQQNEEQRERRVEGLSKLLGAGSQDVYMVDFQASKDYTAYNARLFRSKKSLKRQKK